MKDLLKNVGGKLLRYGYTTGSCAAGACKAAAQMLLSGEKISQVSLATPKGIPLSLEVLDAHTRENFASCAICKDSGDDPDVTNGILVYASAARTPQGIRLLAGDGIGRVTKPGLNQPVGEAAINEVPRQMIMEAVESVCRAQGYSGGIELKLWVPGGKALALRTFNPRMGIEGGISIIGTTGIVEPMSNAALIDTFRLEMKQLAASGEKRLLLTPGNYGEQFAKEVLGLRLESHVSCSNFIGDAIDAAAELGFERILLVGHIGKLVKLGIGVTNTHSSQGDGRVETLIACALEAGAEAPMLRSIASCVTTDAALTVLDEAGLLAPTMHVLGARILTTLRRRAPEGTDIGYVCFSKAKDLDGILCRSDNMEALARLWKEKA